MAVINDPSVATHIGRVGEVATSSLGAQHITLKPIPSSVGVYRVTHRCAIIATQAANSRLFELRNTHATNLLILTALRIRWLQVAAHTAAIEDSLDYVKVTGFTVVDDTDTVTLTGSIKRFGMAAAPGSALIRGATVAGVAAGMTGGTLVEDAAPFAQLPAWLLAAVPTAAVTPFVLDDVLGDDPATYPFVFAQNEGFIIKNRVLLGAAAGSSVYIDCQYVEATAY